MSDTAAADPVVLGWADASEITTYAPLCWGCEGMATWGLVVNAPFGDDGEVCIWVCDDHLEDLCQLQAPSRDESGDQEFDQ